MTKTIAPEAPIAHPGYYPLRIQYVDNDEVVIVEDVDCIDCGRDFKVLDTNYVPLLKRLFH